MQKLQVNNCRKNKEISKEMRHVKILHNEEKLSV